MPKAFVFSLQVVLDQRLRTRDAMIQAHGEKMQKLRDEQAEFDELNARRTAANDTLTRMVGSASLDLEEIRQLQFHLPLLDRKIGRQRRQVESAMFIAEQARLELVEAQRSLQVVERLREQAWREYLLEIDRQEALLLDELASTRYVREHRQL